MPQTDSPRVALASVALWLAIMAAALTTRPVLPVDETRYLAVAWDMWLEGNYLVPHLNGAPYSHKPPLLFWLINAGWAVFGVNEWWPRLVAPLTGLGSLFLARRLARDLWPETPMAASAAPLFLIGGLFWALFTTLTMFDMMLAFCTLLALIGLVQAARGQGALGFALFGLGLGLGVLAKGPAILVHTLPAALLAPMWAGRLAGSESAPGPGPGRWGRWYGGVFAAVLLAAAIGLAWAVPAAMAGGAEYRDAIFWGQSAGRMVESFAHRQPLWFYAMALPVMLLPWLLWPPAWRAVAELPRAWGDGGVRFATAWIVPAVIVFSAISGKQFHYLLPELPAFALLLAYLVFAGGGESRPLDQAVPGAALALVGAAAVALPVILGEGPLGERFALLQSEWALIIVGAGAAAAVSGGAGPLARVGALAAMSAATVIAVHLAAAPVLASSYDLRPLAARLGEWQRAGVAIAHFGKYHGQYHFLGRIEDPITVIGLVGDDERRFLSQHPGGRVVAYHEVLPDAAAPIAVFRFRNRIAAVWDAATLIRHPGIAIRRSP